MIAAMTTAPSVRPCPRATIRRRVEAGLVSLLLLAAAGAGAGCMRTYEGDVQLDAGERAVLEMSGDRVEVRVDNLGPAAIATFLNDGAGLNASDPVLAAGDGWARGGPGPMRLIVRNLDPDVARFRLRLRGHDGLRMELRGGPNATPELRPVPVTPVPDTPSAAGSGSAP